MNIEIKFGNMNWYYGEKLMDETSIRKIEDFWNVKFPGTFYNIIKEHNCGCPELNVFDTKKTKGRVFAGFLNFDLSIEINTLQDYKILKERLPEKVYPFGEDPAGNFICFDYSG